jgi:hypothetical protein
MSNDNGRKPEAGPCLSPAGYAIDGPTTRDSVVVATLAEALDVLRARGVRGEDLAAIAGTPRDAYIGHELAVMGGFVCIEGAEVLPLGDVIVDPDGTEWTPISRDAPMVSGCVYSNRGGARVFRAQTPEEAAESARYADRYAATMQRANDAWAGLTGALTEAIGVPFTVWQTGGMCLAIGACLDTAAGEEGPTVLISGDVDTLPAYREPGEFKGTLVGVYRTGEEVYSGEGYMAELPVDVGDAANDPAIVAFVAAALIAAGVTR